MPPLRDIMFCTIQCTLYVLIENMINILFVKYQKEKVESFYTKRSRNNSEDINQLRMCQEWTHTYIKYAQREIISINIIYLNYIHIDIEYYMR